MRFFKSKDRKDSDASSEMVVVGECDCGAFAVRCGCNTYPKQTLTATELARPEDCPGAHTAPLAGAGR